ncbi:MAG: sigma-70 family RNA polymerase sigma factor [Gammaproteobacteria bacterium]
MDESLDLWFAEEILPHEDSLMRYLARIWPHRDEIDDLRQEVYIRVYEAAVQARPLAPKSFMFTTARHLMADRIRRSRVVSIEATADLDALNVLVDEISPEQRASARQELGRLAEAFDLLPPQCRNVVWMRKVEGFSQKEVASKLGVSEGAIEKQITKGIRALARSLFGSGVGEGLKGGGNEQEATGHGKQRRD